MKSNDVYVSDNETDVSLSCEMSLYLRPERNLQWFRGGQQIMNTDRHTITYTDGNGMGQFGDDTIGSSRVSTLVISEPQLSDSGTYTCAIRNTEVSQDIELTVESAGQYLYSPSQPVHYITLSYILLSGEDNSTTDTTVDPTTANNVTLIIIYSGSGAALLIIAVLMIAAVFCIAAALRRGKR